MSSKKETDGPIIVLQKELKKLLYPFVTLSNDIDIGLSVPCGHPVLSCESQFDSDIRIKYMDVSVMYKIVLHCLSNASNENYIISSEKEKIGAVTYSDRGRFKQFKTITVLSLIFDNFIIKEISLTVSYLEVENFLMINDGASIDNGSCSTYVDYGTLFDIDYNHLEEKPKLLLMPKHFQLFKMLLDNYLKMEYLNVIGFTFPGEEFTSVEDGISFVIDHVGKLKKEKNSKRMLFCQQQEYNSSLLFLVFNQLTEYAATLKSVILTNRYEEHPVMYLNYKIISMKTYLLKLRCMELEILCDSYTSRSITALKALDKKMTQKRSIVENKLLYVKHKLSAFDNLDPKFKDLLREFSNLQKDIKLFESDYTTKY